MLPLQEAGVQSLVRELRPHRMHGPLKKQNSKKVSVDSQAAFLLEVSSNNLILYLFQV